jgi:hypothetical protein
MDTQSPAEKLDARFQNFMAPKGMQFASPEAERAYKERTQMFKDVLQLKKPVRVPVCPTVGFYPFAYAGVTPAEAMHDTARLGYALKKYHTDFLPDSLCGSPIYGCGQLFELMDYKVYRWPGHQLADNVPYQCIEDEYMLADEYDLLINDPSNFFMRTYIPRVVGMLSPWQMLSPVTDFLELPFAGAYVVPFGIPPVQESLKKLIEAGQVAMQWIQACLAIDGETVSTLGIPGLIGGFTKAPFDTLGDTLRGTKALMLDMYRQPKKVLAAVERLVPIAVEMGVRTATNNNNPMTFIPLHKGADGFMSDRDFKKFYWPTLKAVILGLINEGVVPYVFAEGGYNQRLDVITDPDIPAGKMIWMFDQTDLKEVKKRFTGWTCFGGNVPVSLLKTAAPKEIKEHVKRLIDDVAGDGGYILSTGAVLDDAQAQNLHALIEAGKQYGRY